VATTSSAVTIPATRDGDVFLMFMCDFVTRAGLGVDYGSEVRGAGLTWAALMRLRYDELELRALQYIVHRGAYAATARTAAASPWWPASAGATYVIGIATVCAWRLRRPHESVRLRKDHSVHDDDGGRRPQHAAVGGGGLSAPPIGAPTGFEAECAILRAARLDPAMALAVTWFTHDKLVVTEEG